MIGFDSSDYSKENKNLPFAYCRCADGDFMLVNSNAVEIHPIYYEWDFENNKTIFKGQYQITKKGGLPWKF